MRSYYFGCWERPGHVLWLPGSGGHPYKAGRAELELLGRSSHMTDPGPGEIPWGYGLDSGILKGSRSYEDGRARVEQRDGWTALSFWDHSVDSRPGSCSTFVFDRLLSPEDALAAAREAFPPIFARFDFDVVLAEPGCSIVVPNGQGTAADRNRRRNSMTEENVNDETGAAGDGTGDGTEAQPEPIEGQEELGTAADGEGAGSDSFTEPGIGETSDSAETETTEGDVETGDAGDDGAAGEETGETGETGDGATDDAATYESGEEETTADGDEKPSNEILQELHDDIEAALFASQNLPHGREQAVIVAKLESALSWTKKALEKS